MYHSGRNPLKGISRIEGKAEKVDIVKGEKRRRLHKAFLRYHDPNNWPLLREALKAMGRADLIGNGQHHLIPFYQPQTDGTYQSARRKNSTGTGTKTSVVTTGRVNRAVEPADPRALPKVQPRKGQILTQHTGLPPRETGTRKPAAGGPQARTSGGPRGPGKKAR